MNKYTLIDFISDIAAEIDEASGYEFGEAESKRHASYIYQDFIADEARYDDQMNRINLPRFNDNGYDWTPEGAKILAEEYSISYWD